MKLIVSTILLLGSIESAYAREWRGIVPLRSTRSDVVRLFNQCSDQVEACRFTLENENVHILFSGGLPAYHRDCATRLPPETVMFIAVEPRKKLKLADLHLDKRKLQYFDRYPPSKRRYTGYHSRDGLVLGLFKDTIVQIFYIAGDSDEALCVDYYGRPESFVEVPVIHVPVVHSIQGPSSIRAGERLNLSATSNLNETLGYTWTLTAGRIIGGQYTNQIMIDTTGLAGQSITITAEIEHAFGVRASGSTVVQILPN